MILIYVWFVKETSPIFIIIISVVIITLKWEYVTRSEDPTPNKPVSFVLDLDILTDRLKSLHKKEHCIRCT